MRESVADRVRTTDVAALLATLPQASYPGVHARLHPDKPACVMALSGAVVTYGELDAGSNRLARLMRARGLRRGDHVAICLDTHPRFFEVAWAAQRSGLYYTVLNPRLSTDEIAYILDDCGARALIASHDLAGVAVAARRSAPGVELALMLDGTRDGFEAYEVATASESDQALPDQSEGYDMLYTGGTTGRPRGVVGALPEGPMGQSPPVTLLAQVVMGFDGDTVYLSPAPPWHAAPLRFSMAVHRVGGTVVMMERFDAQAALRAIERHRVTHSQWVPTMLQRLLRLPDEARAAHDLSSHVYAVHAGAPCPPEVKERVIDWWGPIVHEYCGGTEGNGLVYCDSHEWLAHRGTVGRPIAGELHICDDDGAEVPTGSIGLVYYGNGGSFEYHNDPGKTAEARNPTGNGWTTIGDIGFVDGEGYLYLVDRRGMTIVCGGVNVYPQEVENVLVVHPAVADAAVFGVPDDDLGESVKAVVQPVDMAQAGPDLGAELIAYCRGRLAHVKCPRSVDFRAELPRHPSGKLLKRLLRDEYWAGRRTRIGN